VANECTHALLFLGDELLRALSEFVLHYETHGFPVRQDRRTVNESHFSIALVGFFYAVLVDAPDRDAGRSGIALERSFCSIKLVERIRVFAADGVHHIVEVAFGANIKTDTEVLAQGGSIATYATNAPTPEIPVWQLVFVNAKLFAAPGVSLISSLRSGIKPITVRAQLYSSAQQFWKRTNRQGLLGSRPAQAEIRLIAYSLVRCCRCPMKPQFPGNSLQPARRLLVDSGLRVNEMRKLVYFIAAVLVFIFGVGASFAQGLAQPIQDPIQKDQHWMQNAILKGDTASMEIYLQRGYVKINTECVAPCSGVSTWLEYACNYGGNADSLEYLLAHGADILYVDSRGLNALRYCLVPTAPIELQRIFRRHLEERLSKTTNKRKVLREQLTIAVGSNPAGDGNYTAWH
jgi:hypothetical protein